jgi:predicted O-methyltransferase YrrM
MNNKQIIEKADVIFGAFSLKELEMLVVVADDCKKRAIFVEIGSYCGRSSLALGLVAKRNDCDLTCVDNFVTIPPFLNNSDEVKNTFINNMKTNEANYELLNMTSEEASKVYNKEIDLLFIDGDHRYEGIKMDCERWIPKVKLNGYILFHDFVGSWVGISQYLDELDNLKRLYTADSLLVTRKMYD